MTYLLDTHILLWAAFEPNRLQPAARNILVDTSHVLLFSAASIWEVAIKFAKHPETFRVDPDELRQGLLERSFQELPIRSAHTIATAKLPLLHRDPFDRLLVAQSIVEGYVLTTVDQDIVRYQAPVCYVG